MKGEATVPGGALFYVVWHANIAAMFALSIAGMGWAATPFLSASLLCAGFCIGWNRAGRRKGGESE